MSCRFFTTYDFNYLRLQKYNIFLYIVKFNAFFCSNSYKNTHNGGFWDR